MSSQSQEINVVDPDSDCDILEVAYIPSATTTQTFLAKKRRKSSPLLDPIPSYSPTPLPILAKQQQQQLAASRRKTPPANSASAFRPVSRAPVHDVEEPIMWTPKPPKLSPPQQQQQVNDGDTTSTTVNYNEQYKSPRITKQRIAHKPTIPQNKSKQPRIPLGVSKVVPISLRAKYLDVIVKEFLKTGHKEDESYSEALREEQNLANQAKTKSIYINFVAQFKKRIREKAGIPTLPHDDNTKYVNGNKVVSHDEILIGKAKGTFSIQRKRRSSDPSELSEYELYDKLMRYVMPIDKLEAYNYPCPDLRNCDQRLPPLGKDNQRQKLKEFLSSSYICERCTKVYRVDEVGLPLPDTGKCIYHPGHLWDQRINRSNEKRFSCCKNDASDLGCSSNQYHVHKGELEIANYKGYVTTQPKPERDPNKHGIYALDCEMCYTTYGLELTRVTVINYKSQVVYEQLVKPTNHILDYNTKFSGIKEGDLETVTKTLIDVQRDLLEMFSSKTILIGHSLDSDMKALKIFHSRVIDTAFLFPHKRGLPFKRALRTLMVENLKTIIQEDSGHDSKEDANAAFRLVMWKCKTDVPEKPK